MAEQPPEQPVLTAASVAAPISIDSRKERFPFGDHGTILETVLIASLAAPMRPSSAGALITGSS